MIKMIADIIDVNHSVLSGAMDIIVVKNDEDNYVSSPFHVRFGTLKILKVKEKTVNIYVNNKKCDLTMKLSSSGHAYFIREQDIDLNNNIYVARKKSDLEVEVDNKTRENEIKLEKKFVMGIGLENNSNSFINNFEREERSPPNTPISSNTQLEKIQINEEFESIEECKKEYDLHIVPSFKVNESNLSPRIPSDNHCIPMINSVKSNSFQHLKSIEISLCYKELISNPEKAEEIFKQYIVNKDEFMSNPWKILNHPNLLICYSGKLYTYNAAIPLLMGLLVYKEELSESVINNLLENKSIFDFLRSKKPKLNSIKLNSNSESCEESVSKNDKKIRKKNSIRKMKYLTPSSNDLKMLGLVEGRNEIAFVCYSKLSGKQILKAEIYVWNSNSKIIISDVDGTITRSDVLGHIMPIVGKDWSHEGIVDLYNNIQGNGYKFIYLTARSICQSAATKNYLQNLSQNNKKLPRGPVILSPDGLITSLKREVIDRRPQDFKIACLSEIRNLFGKNNFPYYSGFGNRSTDATAYRSVGIELFRIFIVNEKGHLTQLNNSCQKSYNLLNQIVSDVFPIIREDDKEKFEK